MTAQVVARDSISDAVKKGGDKLEDAADSVGDGLRDGKREVEGAARDANSDAKGAARDAEGDAKGAARDAKSEVKGAARDAEGAGRDAHGGLDDTVRCWRVHVQGVTALLRRDLSGDLIGPCAAAFRSSVDQAAARTAPHVLVGALCGNLTLH